MPGDAKPGLEFSMFVFDCLRITAPGISLFVMLTGFAGVWLGSGGDAGPSLIISCVVGIGLASAAASVFNNCYDRDIDRLMERTCRRPLAAGRLNPALALPFGVFLSLVSFATLLIFTGVTPAILALCAILIYALLYTVALKRRTPLATEIGGLSGALPPVIGWVAARGGIGIEGAVLFAMMFLWQPPHFWSLAMSRGEDYRKAGIPSMPLASSEERTKKRALIYILLLVPVSLMPYVLGMSGRMYGAVSAFFGGIYILLGLAGLFSGRDLNKYIFYYSILYLFACFVLMAVDIQQ